MPPSINNNPDKKSIAVLPFRNLSEKIENEYFSDGITEDIIAHLSKLKNLKVVSRTSIMQYKNTDKNLTEIGDELNVTTILEGSVRRDNERIRIVAQLIDAEEDEHLWTETYDEQLTEIFDIQSSVAEKIATSLKTTIPSSDKQLFDRKVTKNLLAYDLYLKGRYHWNKRMPDELKKGIDFFEKALKIDPEFAHAYSGLADSYIILGNFGILPPEEAFTKGKKAAHNALKLNDMLAEAHTSLALAQMHYDWKWQDAETGFKKAIELDPSYAMAYSLYASYLTILKRSDEAKVFREKARELDPISPAILLNESLELYFEKKYDQTIIHGHPTIMAVTGYVHAVSGKKDEARDLLEILLEKSHEEYIGPFWIAVLYAGLGENDQALTWLEKSCEQKDGILVYLDVIPIFEHLHSDTRFINILTQMGLRS
jgi:TolB-like protein